MTGSKWMLIWDFDNLITSMTVQPMVPVDVIRRQLITPFTLEQIKSRRTRMAHGDKVAQFYNPEMGSDSLKQGS